MYTNSQKKKLRKAAKTDAARKSHSGISTAEEISNAAMPLCQPYIIDLRQHISLSCGHSYILSFCVSKPTCQNSCVKVSSAIRHVWAAAKFQWSCHRDRSQFQPMNSATIFHCTYSQVHMNWQHRSFWQHRRPAFMSTSQTNQPKLSQFYSM